MFVSIIFPLSVYYAVRHLIYDRLLHFSFAVRFTSFPLLLQSISRALYSALYLIALHGTARIISQELDIVNDGYDEE